MYYDENGNEVKDMNDLPAKSFYKNKKTDQIWWRVPEPFLIQDGSYFSFDRKTVYNTYKDYYFLPKDKKEIFDLENPWYAVRFNGVENVSKKVREAFKEEMGYYPTYN